MNIFGIIACFWLGFLIGAIGATIEPAPKIIILTITGIFLYYLGLAVYKS